MLSFVSPLASQIGFLIASLNKSNYKSLALELSQVNLYVYCKVVPLPRLFSFCFYLTGMYAVFGFISRRMTAMSVVKLD
jgi:hypothetical protein